MKITDDMMDLFRMPTAFEQERIAIHVGLMCDQQIRYRTYLGIIFCLIGLIMLRGEGLLSVLICIAGFALCLIVMFSIQKYKRIREVFNDGSFLALDCSVDQILKASQKTGIQTVTLRMKDGKPFPGEYSARREGLRSGAQVIFIYAKIPGSKPVERIYTPYMLKSIRLPD